MKFPLCFLSALLVLLARCPASGLSATDLTRIGRKVWVNECNGTVAGLTSWNAGEDFASLGIGHFIWYPAGRPGPFEESFPKLIRFLDGHNLVTPAWMHGPCPWNSRAAFLADANGARQAQLRELLSATVPLQAQFLAERMQNALPKMLAAAEPAGRAGLDKVRANFERLRSTGRGTFALIDYVNFKGEGTKITERYAGQGWGLLQVLEGMDGGEGDPVRAFAASARAILARRVKNAPPARHEEKWLPGWEARVARYAAD